jgi:integrating conjugative element protein (TIGR03749 family)
MKCVVLAICALLISVPLQAEFAPKSLAALKSQNKLLWNSVPLAITIGTDTETVLRLPTACEVGLSPTLGVQLHVESVDQVVLLKPTAAFSAQRLALRALDGNQVYLIDITATANATQDHFELIDPRLPQLATPDADAVDAVDAEKSTGDLRVALTRFAAREFYAPERLRGGLSAVRVPVTETVVELYRGGAVRAVPRAQWSYRSHYVTAVELSNLTPDARTLDPRLLRGQWLTATFQHGVIAPMGQQGASTLVYLVSNAPFEAVL